MRSPLFLCIFISSSIGAQSLADTPTPTVSPTSTPDITGSSNLFQFKDRHGEEAETYRLIDNQNRIIDSGQRNVWSMQDSIVSGQQRAKDMTDLLKNEQLQKVFEPMSVRGKAMLAENPELQTPLGVVGGAVGLWVGRTMRLFKGDGVSIATRIEARMRSGEFSLDSPLVNGRLAYSTDNGMTMNVNRKIDSIDTRAELNYSQQFQYYGGALTKPIAPHVEFSIGANQLQSTNQTDGRASINYNFNF